MGIKRQCRALGRSENRGGGGGSGASRNLRPFEWEGFAFFPSKTTLTSIWKHCAPLLLRRPYNGKFVTDCFLIWWHEKKDRKKLGNRKKNSSVFILDKNLGHMTLLSLGVSHKCCYMCIWFGHEKRMSIFFTANFRLTLTSTSK